MDFQDALLSGPSSTPHGRWEFSLENRWVILTVLFLVRTAMGFQFQSVASVSSLLIGDLHMDYTGFGLLIGIYQLPGIVLAIPGGLLGRRFGEKRVVVAALGLMSVGGLVVGASNTYEVAFAGRLASGVGAVLLNVLLAKMTTDWFAGREIVTAMAILVSSWPLGISLGLISLGSLASVSSWMFVMYLTAGVSLVALALVCALYRRPTGIVEGQGTKPKKVKLSRQELWLVMLAGLIWALFNMGFISLPSFAPEFLISNGYTLADAGTLVSVVTWLTIPAVQLGGYVAERINRPNLVLIGCFSGIGLGVCLLPFSPNLLVLLVVLGLLFGPPAGIIMALPGEVLRLENRAAGMGIYYTFYYAGMAVFAPLAGAARDFTGSAAAPLWLGGVMLFIAIVILGIFRSFQRQSRLDSVLSERI